MSLLGRNNLLNDPNVIGDSLTITSLRDATSTSGALRVEGGVSIGGNLYVNDIDINTVSLNDGSSAAPSIAFTNDPDTGFYRLGAGDIGMSLNSVLNFDFNASQSLFTPPIKILDTTNATSTITGALQILGGIGCTQDIHCDNLVSNSFSATGVSLADGSAAAPSLSFVSEATTGLYRKTTNTMGIATGGIEQMTISDTYVTVPKDNLEVGTTAGASRGIEIGDTNGTATTPYIDFHSGATPVDYDARISVTGGTGASGNGTVTITSSDITLTTDNLTLGTSTTSSLAIGGNINGVSISNESTLSNNITSGTDLGLYCDVNDNQSTEKIGFYSNGTTSTTADLMAEVHEGTLDHTDSYFRVYSTVDASSSAGSIRTAGGIMSTKGVYVGGEISMGSTIGDKVNLYSTTYKLGIAGSTLYYDVADTAHHEFRHNGTEVARVDSAGVDVTGGITATTDIYTTGSIVCGADSTSSETVNGLTVTGKIISHNDGTPDQVDFGCHRHSATAGRGGTFYANRSRGTAAAPTIVSDGDSLLTIGAAGFDGTDYATSARIDLKVDGTPGANQMPGSIDFLVAPAGSQVLASAMTIGADKVLTLANYLDGPVTELKSATTNVDVSAATAPSSGQVLTATSSTAATWQTPSTSVPTTITVANEASDSTCFPAFFTTTTGDLAPKTNANFTFNSVRGRLMNSPWTYITGGSASLGNTDAGLTLSFGVHSYTALRIYVHARMNTTGGLRVLRTLCNADTTAANYNSYYSVFNGTTNTNVRNVRGLALWYNNATPCSASFCLDLAGQSSPWLMTMAETIGMGSSSAECYKGGLYTTGLGVTRIESLTFELFSSATTATVYTTDDSMDINVEVYGSILNV